MVKSRDRDAPIIRTLCGVHSKHLIECENFSCIFPLLCRINNHDVPGLSDIIDNGLFARLPGKKRPYTTVDTNHSCNNPYMFVLVSQLRARTCALFFLVLREDDDKNVLKSMRYKRSTIVSVLRQTKYAYHMNFFKLE